MQNKFVYITLIWRSCVRAS